MLAMFLFGRGKSILLLFELFVTLAFLLSAAVVLSVIVAAVISKLVSTERKVAPASPSSQGMGG
jgi:hypothetical protein